MASILITDDEPAIRKLLTVMFKDAGYVVYQASNGVEAMRVLETKKVDIMIIDIVMPEKGGIETIMQVREKHPDLDLIVVSGKVSIENDAFQNLIKQYKVFRVFDKPFEKEDIFDAVEELSAGKV